MDSQKCRKTFLLASHLMGMTGLQYNPRGSLPQDHAKNYQLWNHRRKCALRAGPSSAQRELEFAAEALGIDEKNYHAWAHRMAIVQVNMQ